MKSYLINEINLICLILSRKYECLPGAKLNWPKQYLNKELSVLDA